MRVCVSNTALVALLIASAAVRTASEVVLEVAVPEQAPPPGGVAVRRFNLAVTSECPRWLCPTFTSGWRLAVLAKPAEQP